MNVKRIAESLRVIARELGNVADELEPERLSELEYADPGSEMARVNEMLAQMYLTQALRRYSPTRPPSA